jgi:hypothetical protein
VSVEELFVPNDNRQIKHTQNEHEICPDHSVCLVEVVVAVEREMNEYLPFLYH